MATVHNPLMNTTAAKTITLGKQTFIVTKETAHGLYLRGARGGDYTLVQNVKDSTAYGLVGRGGRDGGWWRRDGDNFTAIG